MGTVYQCVNSPSLTSCFFFSSSCCWRSSRSRSSDVTLAFISAAFMLCSLSLFSVSSKLKPQKQNKRKTINRQTAYLLSTNKELVERVVSNSQHRNEIPCFLCRQSQNVSLTLAITTTLTKARTLSSCERSSLA